MSKFQTVLQKIILILTTIVIILPVLYNDKLEGVLIVSGPKLQKKGGWSTDDFTGDSTGHLTSLTLCILHLWHTFQSVFQRINLILTTTIIIILQVQSHGNLAVLSASQGTHSCQVPILLNWVERQNDKCLVKGACTPSGIKLLVHYSTLS